MRPERVAATLREWVAVTGSPWAVALVDGVEVSAYADGSTEGAEAGDAAPLELVMPPPPGLEPFVVTPDTGEVSGPLGALEGAAESVRALAAAVGAPAVVLAALPTIDGTPLAISAREGEPLVMTIGDDQYEMSPAWPPPLDAV